MGEFENLELTVRCAEPPQKARAALDRAAGEFGGAVRSLRTSDGEAAWRVSAGTWLATNPNAALWSLRVTRTEGALRLQGEASVFPWTRAKLARITGLRLKQFADVLAAKLGSGPERKLEPRDHAPFAAPPTPADACLTFAVNAAQAALSIAFVFVVLFLLAIQIIERQMAELAGRAMILDRVGHPALPSMAEIAGFGLGSRLLAAALLAMPMAFFMGLTHALVHAFGELWRPIARLAPWAAVFLLLLGLFAFWPALPVWASVPYALLVPVAAQMGTTLVWGRRREFLKPPQQAGRRRVLVRVAAAVLVVGVVMALMPALRAHDELLDSLALFRDRWMLTSGPGRSFAQLYYRLTPYAAEPLKETFVAPDAPVHYVRSVRTALVVGYERTAVAQLRKHDFVIEWALSGAWSRPWKDDTDRVRRLVRQGRHDLYVLIGPQPEAANEILSGRLQRRTLTVGGEASAGIASLDPGAPDAPWVGALSGASNAQFAAGGLRELSWAGWQAVYYLGAIFAIALMVGALCVPAAVLYRKVPPRVANGTVLATLAVSVIGLAIAYRASPVGEVASLRGAGVDGLLKGLASPHADVRHEAAFRLYRALENERYPRDRVAGPLAGAIADTDVRVRLWACGAAGRTFNPVVRAALLKATEDPEYFVRYRAAEGLGWLDSARTRSGREADSETLRILEKMARTGSWYEQMYALSALRRIDPENW